MFFFFYLKDCDDDLNLRRHEVSLLTSNYQVCRWQVVRQNFNIFQIYASRLMILSAVLSRRTCRHDQQNNSSIMAVPRHHTIERLGTFVLLHCVAPCTHGRGRQLRRCNGFNTDLGNSCFVKLTPQIFLNLLQVGLILRSKSTVRRRRRGFALWTTSSNTLLRLLSSLGNAWKSRG